VDPRRAAVRLSGVVSHLSAAQLWGLSVVRAPDLQHVTVGRRRAHLDDRGVHLHWADVPSPDVGEGVTGPVRTVLDCARTLPFGEGLAVADSALRRGLVHRPALRAAAGRLTGPGAPLARRVAVLADGRAANPFESVLRSLAIGAGLDVVPQVRIRGDAFSARVDLADVGRRLVLEADSFEFHGGRSALVRDCRRYDELVLLDWRVLRFAWEHVMLHGPWVTDVLARAATLRQQAA
jgi:very-short-patch-repair endonuclease